MKKVLKGLAAGVFALALTFSTPLETNASDWIQDCGHAGKYRKTVIAQEATCYSSQILEEKCTKCDRVYYEIHTDITSSHTWIYYSSFRKICIKCGHAQDFYD